MQSSKKSGISRNSIIKTAAASPQVPVAKTPAAKPKLVTFQIQSKPGSKVYIAGDFNEWNNLEQELCDHNDNGVYQIAVELKPGTYEYKFHINGSWCVDPGNPNFNRNPMGTLNSVITVE
jgi:5'-AMP-activated protein kinase regulatory beta subunit